MANPFKPHDRSKPGTRMPPRPPCAVCGTLYEKHGTAPTCASHDYTDGGHIVLLVPAGAPVCANPLKGAAFREWQQHPLYPKGSTDAAALTNFDAGYRRGLEDAVGVMVLGEAHQWEEADDLLLAQAEVLSLVGLLAELNRMEEENHDDSLGGYCGSKVADFKRRYREAIKRNSSIPVLQLTYQDGWQNFICYLIDHCERETVTEEMLHRTAAAFLADPKYSRAGVAVGGEAQGEKP